MSKSLAPEYFDDVYGKSADPWNFETSEYEDAKYADTLRALPRPQYQSALEIGCSIGVLTRKLAERCRHLLSTDVSEKAIQAARRRCEALPQVEFRRMRLPGEYPGGLFDLTVLSEVGYYWNREDLFLAASRIRSHMSDGAHLLLVHWTPVVPDYPLTGDQVHQHFLGDRQFVPLHGHVREQYRLDLLTTGQT